MSLITRCPACQTLFKVVPDQLRISEGWVRCGQCDEIFDASFHLLPTSSEEAPAVVPTGELAVQRDLIASSDATTAPDAIDLESDRLGGPDEVPIEQAQALPDAADNDETQPSLSSHALAAGLAPVDEVGSVSMGWLNVQAGVLPPPHSMPVLPDQDALEDPDEPELARMAEMSDVSFLRDKHSHSVWRKPLMRATLVLLSFVLLLGLSGQIVFHERDRIVALEPGLKPWLLAFCRPLNCTLSPLRKIEAVVIESSSFTKIRGNSYRLNFTVKNTGTNALAVPAIELTLTDSLDQPVVRRVFLPAELGVNSTTLAAGFEWPASLAMAVKAAGMADRVAGYRLLAFYP